MPLHCTVNAGVAGVVVLPVAGIAGGLVQVGRGMANEKDAIDAKKAGKIWNKVGGVALRCVEFGWTESLTTDSEVEFEVEQDKG